nr:hypothetical protein [Tanacetum cinerariifolium]
MMPKPGLGLECLRKRQIGEDAIISCRDRVYKLFPREPVSRSTPSRFQIKQVCWRKATSRSESQNCPTENKLCPSPST